jgi:AAA domain
MEWSSRSPKLHSLRVRAITYQYRYCPRCGVEWPANYTSCQECAHWLGDHPQERTEWQVAPAPIGVSEPKRYELVGASAFSLRLVCGHAPADAQLFELATLIRGIVTTKLGGVCEVDRCGWLIWTGEGLRNAFRQGCEIEARLAATVPRIKNIFLHTVGVRWGIWIDQYIVPFDRQDKPAIGDVTAAAIFHFEPDNMALSSEAIYRINQHFVSVPRRLLNGEERQGFRMTGHKQPSASDHAETMQSGAFVGRGQLLAAIEDCWARSTRIRRLAITAAAGSGKTRLVREWLRIHPEIRVLTANFSLFGGDTENFASQLAELPHDRLDCEALVQAVVGRVRREEIQVLVLDDLHWADPEGLEFLQALLAAVTPTFGMLVVLVSRPSGRGQLHVLNPDVELKLDPLALPAAKEIARLLGGSEPVATEAARRSSGNPLFVEQFIAWAAEASFRGGQSGPRTLYQIIAARVEHLSKVRVAGIRDRLRWGRAGERQVIDRELGQLEAEVGRWLDRLETGDYADRIEVARHLIRLERLDYEIFLTSMLVGRPRARSSRLREAIERLLIGSADQVLAELKRRAANGTTATKEDVSREAKRAADILFAAFDWTRAREFYELAHSSALWERNEIGGMLAQCGLRSRESIKNDSEIYLDRHKRNLIERPSVDALDLPYIWADLGRRFQLEMYFVCAESAARAINDRGLAVWAKRKAMELRTS